MITTALTAAVRVTVVITAEITAAIRPSKLGLGPNLELRHFHNPDKNPGR